MHSQMLESGTSKRAPRHTSTFGRMLTDRVLLAARIREVHHLELPSFTTGCGVDTSSTVAAEALATETSPSPP
ncbi:hypothetical protein RQCS_62160 (plasmid) [Rhodococcus qingshengii]|nr:hypothetical protein RQCS_62160 [Rhodococcus qingshengii]